MNLGPSPDTEAVYYLCPDKKCTGFEDEKFRCRYDCPRQAKKAVVCWQCGTVIVVKHDCCHWARIDCTCGASVFTLMASVSRRHNLRLNRRPRASKVSA